MTEKALTALKKSIKHWERLATGNHRPDEGTGPHDCALCGLYWKRCEMHWNRSGPRAITRTTVSCDGCPVKGTTGKDCCEGTPHPDIVDFEDEFMGEGDCRATYKFRELAQAELDFLKSLLPKEVEQ